MRILVTGANGFAGRHLVRRLAECGHEPVAHCHATADTPGDAPEGATDVMQGDLRDPEAASELVVRARPDACVHLAGLSFVPDGAAQPDNVLAVNSLGTLNLLEAFRTSAASARMIRSNSALCRCGL